MGEFPLVRTVDEAAIALHEMFSSYVRAGFTRAEALQIVIELMVNHEQHGSEHDAPT